MRRFRRFLGMPRPLSSISNRTCFASKLKRIFTAEAPECRWTFVKASCTARNNAISASLCNRLSFGVEVRALGNSLEIVKKIQFQVASGGGEHKAARFVRLRLPRLQTLCELCRNRNLAFLVRLWCPSPVGLVSDAHSG